MTDDNKRDNASENLNEEHDAGVVPQSPVTIHAQYLKDLSFENPNAPQILQKADKPPEVDIDIAVDTQIIESNEGEDLYEVILSINASAMREGQAMFIAEIKYGAAVSIRGLEEKRRHSILFVEVPKMIFPFARLILSNATQWGAYVPLQLALVDFRAMYLQRFGENEADDTATSEPTA